MIDELPEGRPWQECRVRRPRGPPDAAFRLWGKFEISPPRVASILLSWPLKFWVCDKSATPIGAILKKLEKLESAPVVRLTARDGARGGRVNARTKSATGSALALASKSQKVISVIRMKAGESP